ncbi:ThrRS/AlaRS common domain-containing protein [Lactarius indigo]|nr:ThrRS/AlaRS common domain-containing protein [Lactarius indigo]
MAIAPLIQLPPLATDYHRISDTSVTIPVGLLACQRDPLLRSLDTSIISASLLKPSPPSSVKKGSHIKQEKVSSVPAFHYPVLRVVLHDTVLFPEGGGQPTDIGILTSEDGKVWNVELVKRHGGVAVHYVRSAEDIVGDVPDVFVPRKRVSLELGQVGFQRRLDHMSMHTAQHLLSAVIEKTLKVPTSYLVAHAVAFSRVQDEVNRYVLEERRVHVEVQELSAGQTGIDSGDSEASSRELGRGLPSDYTGGVHRMVIIDGVDRTPCCGTHLPTLASLQLFLFPVSPSSSSGPSRHYFVAGPRLLNHLGSVQSLLTRTTAVVSCGPPELPDRVAVVVEESKRREKRVDDLERELARVLGVRLAEEMAQWRAAGGEGEWAKFVSRVDDSPSAQPFLQAVTLAFAAHLSGQGYTANRYTLLLVSSPSSQTSSSTTSVGEELKRQFKTLKGGGKGTRWSGKFVGVWLESREGKTALSHLLGGEYTSITDGDIQ